MLPVANSDKFRGHIAVLRLTLVGVVMMVMVCAGKLGCRMFARGMFAGDRAVSMRAVRACSAMIRQSGAMAPHRSAARTGCRGVTAQPAPRAVASTTARVSAAAAATATATATAATTGVAASAAGGDAR